MFGPLKSLVSFRSQFFKFFYSCSGDLHVILIFGLVLLPQTVLATAEAGECDSRDTCRKRKQFEVGVILRVEVKFLGAAVGWNPAEGISGEEKEARYAPVVAISLRLNFLQKVSCCLVTV